MTDLSDDPLLVEPPRAGVCLLRLNRPQARNAINSAMRRRLIEALHEMQRDVDVRAVVVTGNESAFAAGADISEMKDAGPVELRARGVEEFWRAIAGFPKPLIAAVNGYALGAGCELALACDIVVAGEGAQFGLPEVRLGIMPGGGGTQRLTRAAGKQIAMRYMLTGDRFGAADAKAWGVVSDVVADGDVVTHGLDLAARLAELPPLALAQIKQAALKGLDAGLESGLTLERQSYYFLNTTEDKAEGVAAFLEKRKPKFKGK